MGGLIQSFFFHVPVDLWQAMKWIAMTVYDDLSVYLMWISYSFEWGNMKETPLDRR